jgi:probable rRNA maturation factor
MISVQYSVALLPGSPARAHAALLKAAARRALHSAYSGGEADVTVLLTDDGQVQALNRQYLEIDAPTDVLSFPAGETDPDSGNLYLGDVIISYPRALAQAETGGHSVEAELQLLVVHGVLHLLGYDHAEEAEQAAMWAVQAEIMAGLQGDR